MENNEIVKMVQGRSDFVLLQAQPIFSSGPFRVIQCDDTLLDDISK